MSHRYQGSPPGVKAPKAQVGRSARLKLTLGLLLPTLCGSCNGWLPSEPGVGERGAPATLHRLTRAEYRRTIEVLFAPAGPGLPLPTDLEADTVLHGYTTVAGSELTVSPRAAEQFEAAALSLAHWGFSDGERRSKLVGCEPAAVPDKLTEDACARGFFERFGLRALRRPLTPEELGEQLGLAATVGKALGNSWTGLEYSVAALLQSPHFLFRVERGEPEPVEWPATPTRWRFTSWEMASRLSYALWGGPPDDELLAAAASGTLATEEGVRRQAERLLSTDSPQSAANAQAGVGRFFAEYLKLDRLSTVSKDKQVFPQLTEGLLGAMRGEVERVAADLALGPGPATGEGGMTGAATAAGGDLRDLLATDHTFVNAELAKFYGLDEKDWKPGEWRRVTLPAEGPRGGLLTMAAFLTINAHETLTSPTLRGRFIREVLLCQDIPPPPPGVVTSLQEPAGMGEKTTLRQRLEQHRQNPACRGCHERMDPLGLSLENFDAIGGFRTTENTLPIDATATLDEVTFTGGRELGRTLREHPRLAECVARQLYRYATGHLEVEGEQAQIAKLGTALRTSGFKLRALLVELVASEGFRFTDAPEPLPDSPSAASALTAVLGEVP